MERLGWRSPRAFKLAAMRKSGHGWSVCRFAIINRVFVDNSTELEVHPIITNRYFCARDNFWRIGFMADFFIDSKKGYNNLEDRSGSLGSAHRLNEQGRTCPPNKIDVKLQIPGHKRCYAKEELTEVIVANVLTHGAAGGSAIIEGLLRGGGMNDPHMRSAISFALGNGSVQGRLMSEARSNPRAAMHFVNQLDYLGFRTDSNGEIGRFVQGLYGLASSGLGEVVNGAAEVARDVAVGVGKVFSSVGDTIKGNLGTGQPAETRSEFGNR